MPPTPVTTSPVYRESKSYRIQGAAMADSLTLLAPQGVRFTPGRAYQRHRLWFGICHFAYRTWEANFTLEGRRGGMVVLTRTWKMDALNDQCPSLGFQAETNDETALPYFVNIRTQPTATGSDYDCIPGPEGAVPPGAKVWFGRGASNNATNFLFYTLIMPPFDYSGEIDEWVLRPIRWQGANIPATALANLNWAFLHFSVQSELRA
jgi:hypothetical protein